MQAVRVKREIRAASPEMAAARATGTENIGSHWADPASFFLVSTFPLLGLWARLKMEMLSRTWQKRCREAGWPDLDAASSKEASASQVEELLCQRNVAFVRRIHIGVSRYHNQMLSMVVAHVPHLRHLDLRLSDPSLTTTFGRSGFLALARLPQLRELTFEGVGSINFISMGMLAETLRVLAVRCDPGEWHAEEWNVLCCMKNLERLEIHSLRGHYGALENASGRGQALPLLEALLIVSSGTVDDERLAALVSSCSSSLKHLTVTLPSRYQRDLLQTRVAARACPGLRSWRIQTYSSLELWGIPVAK